METSNKAHREIMDNVKKLEDNVKKLDEKMEESFAVLTSEIQDIKRFIIGNQDYGYVGIKERVARLEQEQKDSGAFFSKENMLIWEKVKLWMQRIDAWAILFSLLGFSSVSSFIFMIYEIYKIFTQP